jgi:hypothetical protein
MLSSRCIALTRTEHAAIEPVSTARAAVIESCRAREGAALERLGVATAGRSLCSLSRAGDSVPAAKYHEGAVAALSEARRAVASIPGDVAADDVRAALLGVGARWRGESGTAGRSGPDWVGYLAGGIDALDQLIDDDEGRDVVPRTDRELDGVVVVRPDLPVLDALAAAGAAPAEADLGRGAGTSGRRSIRARVLWPMRRIAAVALIAPALLALFVAASGGEQTAVPGGWTALVALLAVTSATTLATYLPLPGTGRRLDLGCTPCASVAALSVVIAGAVLTSTPHDVPTAILAVGVAAFGLRQRLANASTCAA